jgi:hypothetical protein
MTHDSNKKKKMRALMAELGTNYTTALRVYETALATRQVEEDAAVAWEASDPTPQDRARESAAPAAGPSALNLQFSDARNADVTAEGSE